MVHDAALLVSSHIYLGDAWALTIGLQNSGMNDMGKYIIGACLLGNVVQR